MYMELTEEALLLLQQRVGNDHGLVKLVFDTEGCGCAVNGVPALWLVDELAASDEQLESNTNFTFIIDRHHLIYYEERIKLHANHTAGTFRLSSAQQVYSIHVKCVDRRVSHKSSSIG
ncbi:iron-sulfur cluster biosynthesis family protein [Paenibacillus sp. 481]|uniref:iron-sulfur cluster biosynthesis family protein n=1 Tax=Paenibacillus sp. 481 TaxID=2835869 RepID=UPI001E4990B9|nr:iron-sulfur cluster biosynthesis family protein [Paenibacillus sp. 481]UHA73054.1 iron-sulfur cluster biosynthesis family protein [Paenibacillus sp. 481]